HELHLQLAREELPLELRVLADVRRDHLADLPGLQQQAEAPVVDTGVVRDAGQILHPALDERVDEILGDAAEAEAADDERRAVGDVAHRITRGRNDLVDHGRDDIKLSLPGRQVAELPVARLPGRVTWPPVNSATRQPINS